MGESLLYDPSQDEDIQFADSMQETVDSPGCAGVPLSYQERRIYRLHEELFVFASIKREHSQVGDT